MSIMLGDICKFQSGGTPARGKAEYFNGSIPWITTTALTGGQIDANDAVDWITEKAIKESSAKIIPQNSIMVGMRVGVGKVAINTVAMSTNQDIISLLEVDESKWNKDFLCKYLQSKREYLNSQARGATIKGIKIDVLSKLIVPQISLEDQRHISQAIDNVKRIIDFRKQEIRELDELIKARFVELFGNPIKNEKHWETFKLGECLKRIDNGKSFTCDVQARTGECPAILKLSAVTYGDYRPEENKALLDEKQFVESTEVHSGDLLFTRKNTPELVGMAAYVYNTPNHLMMPDLIFRLVPNERMTAIFLWQLINNREFRPVIQSIAGGSAKSMSNISKERLNNISVICPPINEQIRLNEMINQVNKSKVAILKNYSQGGVLSYDN